MDEQFKIDVGFVQKEEFLGGMEERKWKSFDSCVKCFSEEVEAAQVRNALSTSSPQIMDRSEAASAAVDSMEVKHGEPLVVQFAAP